LDRRLRPPQTTGARIAVHPRLTPTENARLRQEAQDLSDRSSCSARVVVGHLSVHPIVVSTTVPIDFNLTVLRLVREEGNIWNAAFY
jgi:hypothetical protein